MCVKCESVGKLRLVPLHTPDPTRDRERDPERLFELCVPCA